jgi:hypothetical protein
MGYKKFPLWVVLSWGIIGILGLKFGLGGAEGTFRWFLILPSSMILIIVIMDILGVFRRTEAELAVRRTAGSKEPPNFAVEVDNKPPNNFEAKFRNLKNKKINSPRKPNQKLPKDFEKRLMSIRGCGERTAKKITFKLENEITLNNKEKSIHDQIVQKKYGKLLGARRKIPSRGELSSLTSKQSKSGLSKLRNAKQGILGETARMVAQAYFQAVWDGILDSEVYDLKDIDYKTTRSEIIYPQKDWVSQKVQIEIDIAKIINLITAIHFEFVGYTHPDIETTMHIYNASSTGLKNFTLALLSVEAEFQDNYFQEKYAEIVNEELLAQGVPAYYI